jgi:hypothetical protein
MGVEFQKFKKLHQVFFYEKTGFFFIENFHQNVLVKIKYILQKISV